MNQYYNDKLSALRLKRCYDIAPPRVQKYLKAEVDHVLQKIRSNYFVLELGCGYGRVLSQIASKAFRVIGIDNAYSNLILAKKMHNSFSNCCLLTMDAINLTFRSQIFDLVICIQNGISVFHVDKIKLIAESIRVTKDNGYIIFSSYQFNRHYRTPCRFLRLSPWMMLLVQLFQTLPGHMGINLGGG